MFNVAIDLARIPAQEGRAWLGRREFHDHVVEVLIEEPAPGQEDAVVRFFRHDGTPATELDGREAVLFGIRPFEPVAAGPLKRGAIRSSNFPYYLEVAGMRRIAIHYP